MFKIILFIALIGHIICGITDCLIGYNGKKRMNLKSLSDPEKLKIEFEGFNLKRPIQSIIFGIMAITMFTFGYLSLCNWMNQYSHTCAVIMYISIIIGMMSLVTHHIICGLIEWFYVRLNSTNEAAEAILEFFKKTIATMIVGYSGWAIFLITMFIAIVTNMTNLPWWTCIFNMAVFMIPLAFTKLPAKANIAGSLMFLGLLFVL